MKKTISVLMSLLLLLTVFAPFAVFAEDKAGTVWSHPTAATEAECIENAVEGVDYEISADTLTYTVKSADGYLKVVSLINGRILNGENGVERPLTLKLNADLDFRTDAGKLVITPINNNNGDRSSHNSQFRNFTFDGQNHTMRHFGLVHNNKTSAVDYYFGLVRSAASVTFRDLTVAESYLRAGSLNGAGMLLGDTTGKTTFTNIHIKDCSMWANDKVGGIWGFESGSGSTVVFEDCATDGLFTFGAYHIGGIAGLTKRDSVTIAKNISVKNFYPSCSAKRYYLNTTVTCPEETVQTHPCCLGNGTALEGLYTLSSGYYWAYAGLYWTEMGKSSHDCEVADAPAALLGDANAQPAKKPIANGERGVTPFNALIHDCQSEYGNGGYSQELRDILAKYDQDLHVDDSFWLYIYGVSDPAEAEDFSTVTYVEAKTPTCMQEGNIAYYVNTLNGQLYDTAYAPISDPASVILPADPDNHEGETIVRGGAEPTCTEEGATGDTLWDCCGAVVSYSEVLPALGHDWGEWTVTKPVSYGVDGEETRVCAVCGETETRAVPVKDLTGRKIQFTKMDDMYYVVHMGEHDRWILREDSKAFDWYDEVALDFEVRLGLGWKLDDMSYKTYVVYLNNQPLEPNADGTYTIPANIGRAVITITGASTPTKDETPTQFAGKISFWEKLVNFFRMIAGFFTGIFR